MPTPTLLKSALTCPHCGVVSVEVMPTDACVYFYQCSGCQAVLHPKAGDCCVFCSYGSVKCPPVQEAGSCCVGSVTSVAPPLPPSRRPPASFAGLRPPLVSNVSPAGNSACSLRSIGMTVQSLG
jgi:hypothetical protein